MSYEKKAGDSGTSAGNGHQQQQQAAQPKPQQNYGSGVTALRGLFHGVIPKAPPGESIKKYVEVFSEINKNYNDQFLIQILDGNLLNTPLSCILISAKGDNGVGGAVVAVHALIVASSGPDLPKQQINYGGKVVEVTRVPGDMIKYHSVNGQQRDPIVDKIERVVSEGWGPGIQIVHADGSVMPALLKADDKIHMHRVFAVASEAVVRTLSSYIQLDQTKFSIGLLTQTNNRVTARLDYSPIGVETAAGLPIRSDIAVITVANSSGQKTDEFETNSMDLTVLDGFINLRYVHNPAQVPYGYMQPTQRYLSEFIVTNLESRLGAVSLEIALFALHSVLLLNRNKTWAQVFRKQYARGNRFRDIGVLGFEVPQVLGKDNVVPGKVDTNSNLFGDTELNMLIDTAVHQGLSVLIDVDERGDNSWANLFFAAEANDISEAQNAIIQAADNLTSGRFSQLWKGGRMFQKENRIHLGYYTDPRQPDTSRDIRDLDNLAMLNIVEDPKYMSIARDYERTFLLDPSVPEEVNLERREAMMRQYVDQNLTITGYARRLRVNSAFLEALGTAIMADGFYINPSNIQECFSAEMRTSWDQVSGSILSPSSASVFRSNTGYNPAQAGFNWSFWGVNRPR